MESNLKETLLENLSLQLQEIEMLQAMFPGKKEVTFDDPSLLLDIEEYVNTCGKSPSHLRFLSFNMNLDMIIDENCTEKKLLFKLMISLPSNYPEIYPNISVISNELSRTSLSQLNEKMMSYMSELDYGEVLLLNLVTWLQENVSTFYVTKEETVKSCEEKKEEELVSMWLYMHHIYNKEKRKDIIHWAEELELTGFSLPGKPGVVHVEGYASNIDEYFTRLRRLSWQRMSCKVKEKCKKRIFTAFEELSFKVNGLRENHMDMGQFFLYLKERDLGCMFIELFGVEGHG